MSDEEREREEKRERGERERERLGEFFGKKSTVRVSAKVPPTTKVILVAKAKDYNIEIFILKDIYQKRKIEISIEREIEIYRGKVSMWMYVYMCGW